MHYMITVYAFNGRTDKKGTHSVKFLAEKITMVDELMGGQVSKGIS